MKRVTLATADALRRILFQEGRVTALHAVAFSAVGLSYLANRMTDVSVPPCTKACGVPALLASLVAWWPIAASWWVARQPGETSNSFRWWQVLFVIINVAAVGGYANTDATTLKFSHAALWSILHFALLMAIVPLAVESGGGGRG